MRDYENAFESEIQADEEDSQKNKYISFVVSQEEFAVEISYIIEIVGLQKIIQLPDMPDFIKGVINLRGKVIPIIDVRKRFKYNEITYNNRTCIIVVKISQNEIGLIVDEVSEVLDIPETQVSPPPQTGKSSKSRFIKGIGRVGEKVKIILDVDKLLSDEEINQIELNN